MPNIPKIKIGDVVYNIKDSEARNQIDNMNNVFCSISVHNGGLTNGEPVDNIKYARTENFLVPPFEIVINNGFEVRQIDQYGQDGTHIKTLTGQHHKWFAITDTDHLYKLVFATPNNDDISFSDAGNIVKSYIDSKEADAILKNKFNYFSYDINQAGTYHPSDYKGEVSVIIKVNPGDLVRIKGGATDSTRIAFLKSWKYFYNRSISDLGLSEESPDFCAGYSGRIETRISLEYVITIPSDCNYLYVFIRDASRIPQILQVNGIDWLENKIIYTQNQKPEVLAFSISGLKYEGAKTLGSSIMQKPTLDSSCMLTMVAPAEYQIKIVHYSADMQHSTESASYSSFNGNAPGLNTAYPNYKIKITKTDGTDISSSDVTLINGLIADDQIYVHINKYAQDINSVQRYGEYKAAVQSAVIKTGNANIPEQKSDAGSPLIVHFSDLHADSERLKRIYRFAEKAGATAIVNTGDTVLVSASDSALYAEAIDAAENTKNIPVYPLVGNHDAGLLYSYTEMYNRYIKYYSEKYGYSTNALPYYYVDNSQWKLRIIAICQYKEHLDQPDFDQDQLEWLIDTLESVPDGYGVLLFAHAPYKWPNGGIIEDFTQTDSLGYPYYGAYGEIGNLVLPLISAFIGRTSTTVSQTINGTELTATADFSEVPSGVEFIAHIHGHTHRDVVGYYEEDDIKQLTIGIDCATAHLGTVDSFTYSFCSELARTFDNEQQDLFNLYGIDRARKNFKICRVGADLTIGMKYRRPIVIPYIVSQNNN